jgi:hypothetical protein
MVIGDIIDMVWGGWGDEITGILEIFEILNI